MKEGQHLEQQTTMRMALAPQQVQFMRLLEMNSPALEEEVQRQLDDNPALEAVDSISDEPHEQDRDAEVYDMKDPDDDPADYIKPSRAHSTDFFPIYADDTPDLFSYLNTQLGLLNLDDRRKAIAEYIIGNIDDDGYLTRSYDDLADDMLINNGIDCSTYEVEDLVKMIQDFDPSGVGARDLWESLRLQLERISPVTLPVLNAKEIVTKYSDMLSKKHYDRIRAKLGIDEENLKEALDVIKRLNPMPGQAVSITANEQKRNHITPDAGVEYDNGRISVYLNNHIPALRIEESFTVDSPIKPSKRHQEAGAFIKAKRDEAEMFISALKQRSNTLLKVTEAIARLQKDFFISGDESRLRPMILEDIKALTGLDVSVISRATKDKYLETASGIYPYKTFFNEAPTDDPDLSAHKIKDEIRRIVDAEDKRHPLSDIAISEALNKNGLNIARRTVTKYRKDMGIADSRLRKY